MIPVLTLYFPYYNQPEALQSQLEIISSYPTNILEKLKLFIVDDGSISTPKEIVEKFSHHINIALHRIDIDIAWNTPEANNLAFDKIDTDYVLRLDIDHHVNKQNIQKIFELDPPEQITYKFSRIECSGKKE